MTPSWEELFRTALAKHFALGGAVGMDEGGEITHRTPVATQALACMLGGPK